MKKVYLRKFLQCWLVILVLILMAMFSVLQPKFMKTTNIMNIISSTCVAGIVALGVTVVMSSGEIDFACGSELAVGAITVILLMRHELFNSSVFGYVLAIIITITICGIIGLFNAFLNIKIGIPAFIATMGTSLILEGVLKIITNSSTIRLNQVGSIFTWLGQGYIGIIPTNVIILIVFSIFMWIYTELTVHGKMMYAVGANAKACNYIGVNSKNQKVKGFVISAAFCGFAGIVQGSMLNSAGATMGSDTLFSALTSLMLGATVFKIGVFNVGGSLLSSLFVSILANGFIMLSMPTYMKDLVQGSILVFAVAFVIIIRRKMVNLS